LRTYKTDQGKRSCHRFFSARFEAVNQNNERWTQERYAMLTDIMVLSIGDKRVVLLDAKWFKENASYVDLDTQNVFVNDNLVFERTTETLIQADQIVSQVCVINHPYKAGTAIILDREFDTLLLPGDD
jgi:hypothetical protein